MEENTMETMLDYIRETSSVLEDIIERHSEFNRQLIDFYKANNYRRIHIIASGSSYNGSLCALYFMKKVLKTDIALSSPFTFANHESPYREDTMYMFISQSGCSTNILEAISTLKTQGFKAVCLTGRNDSDAEKIADLTVNWKCGEEKIGFVTKGVSSLVCFLICFSLDLALSSKAIDGDACRYYLEEMKKAQKIQPQYLERSIEFFNAHKDDFISSKRVVLLSSGPNFGTISEGALKISETCCISASACEAEEFLHGPLYPSTPDDLFLIVDNNTHSSSRRIIEIARALGDVSSKVFVLTNDSSIDGSKRISSDEETDALVSPLYKLTCLQILAHLTSENTNKYEPHQVVKNFKKANKVASKSRPDLYLDLQKIEEN